MKTFLMVIALLFPTLALAQRTGDQIDLTKYSTATQKAYQDYRNATPVNLLAPGTPTFELKNCVNRSFTYVCEDVMSISTCSPSLYYDGEVKNITLYDITQNADETISYTSGSGNLYTSKNNESGEVVYVNEFDVDWESDIGRVNGLRENATHYFYQASFHDGFYRNIGPAIAENFYERTNRSTWYIMVCTK